MSKEKEKRIFLIAIVGVLVVVLLALGIYLFIRAWNQQKESRRILNEIEDYIDCDGNALIYFASSKCEYCEMATPVLKQIAKDYNLDYYEIDKTKLTKKDYQKVIDLLNIEGRTPTMVVFNNRKIKAIQVGFMDGYKMVEWLIRAGLLEEDSVYTPEQYLDFIEFEEFEELRKSQEPVVIGIGSSLCEYCRTAKPILSNISYAHDVPIHYITMNYYLEDEQNKVVDALKEMGYDEEQFVSSEKIITPTLFVIKDNKIVAYLNGLQDLTTYVKFLKDNKVIE